MFKARKILVFGGSFSPPTLAHEAIIAACLQLPDFAEVWVMPSGDRPDKRIALGDRERLAMLEIIKSDRFGNDPRLVVSDFELNLPRPTQTFRTAQTLRSEYPDTGFWFVFGSDSYRSMPDWPHGKELKRDLNVVVLGDKQTLPEVPAQSLALALGVEYSDMSSTVARQRISDNRSLKGLVSEPIEHYLKNLAI